MATYADRVKETTTTTGTGTYSLGGAVTGFRTFVAGAGSTNTATYCIEDGVNWEIGEGTITSGTPDTLSRTTIIASSNAGAAVVWGAGTKNAFLTASANRTVFNDKANTFTQSQTFAAISATTFTGSGSGLTGIPNGGLTNSSLTIGSTAVSLGTTAATLAGVTLSSPTINTPVISFSNAAAVSAAGTTQGTATALTTDYNNVTTVAANAGVILPVAALAGRAITVKNNGVNSLNIYPPSGGTIDALAANTALSIPPGSTEAFSYVTTTGVQTLEGRQSTLNIANSVVYRDASGNFAAGTVTAAAIAVTGNITKSVAVAISAAGTTQGTATAITKDLNGVSTVGAGAGVILPAAVAGLELIVVNTGANALLVYPATGAAIDANATNAAFSLAIGARILFMALSTTQWYSLNATYA